MTDIKTTDDIVIFQLLNSALFLLLKKRGYGDENIALIMESHIPQAITHFENAGNQLLDQLIVANTHKLDPIDHAWMVDIANRAVERNLVNGVPKYSSGQGYACALEALKLATSYRGEEAIRPPESIDTESPLTQDEAEAVKKRVIDGGIALYRAVVGRFGEEAAAKQVLDYIGEQYGIVSVRDLGLSDAQIQEVKQQITAAISRL